MTDKPPVAPLADFGTADLATVGGKCANLGELIRAGLPVPPGFVVTTDAYAAVAREAGIEARLTVPSGDPSPDPAALRAELERTPVPERLHAAIADAYRELGEVPVAVRSSATAEDLPGAAFAGQQDTYLNVVGADEVVAAVRRCWASLWTDRAVAYRREHGADSPDLRIAVIVQTMVDSDVAGVMFTADPVTGDRDRVIVDAGGGLGEAVVSGLVTPDHYVLDPRGDVVEWTAGRGEVVVRPGAGGGVVHDSTAAAEGGGSSRGRLLSDAQLAVLAEHARTIAARFGRPQDIEWAFSDGRAHIVQSRPMTALPPPSVPLNRRQRLMGSILTEYLPVRPYPLDVSTWLGHGPTKMMRDIAFGFGLAGAFENFLVEEDGVVVQIVPPSPHAVPRALLTPFRLLSKARRTNIETWKSDPRFVDFLARADELDALDMAALDWAELTRVPERALGLIGPCRDLRQDYLPGAAVSIARLAVTTVLLRRRHLLGELLGGAHTRTEDANDALQDLAGLVREHPGLYELFTGTEPGEILAAVRAATPDSPKGVFAERLRAFAREFGRRETTTPLLVSPPTMVEAPEHVLGLVRVLVDQPRQEAPGSRSERALAQLLDHPLLRGRRARTRVTRWVRTARNGISFREDTHFHFTAMLPALRRALLEMGARLARAGAVPRPFDVFHLRLDEVLAVEDAEHIPADQAGRLRALVRARAAKRAELTGVRMIDPARVFPRKDTGDALVTGTPASSGSATGTARVIGGPDDFSRLGAGEVLVCPYTNPSWTPLFQRAAAVVVDTGAMGSHAAIVAREYGIPAVMGTGTGTALLADGARITVDGGTGRVARTS